MRKKWPIRADITKTFRENKTALKGGVFEGLLVNFGIFAIQAFVKEIIATMNVNVLIEAFVV